MTTHSPDFNRSTPPPPTIPAPTAARGAAEPIAPLASRHAQPEAHDQAVRDMFERIAPTYDTLNRLLSARIDVAWRHRAVSELSRAPSGAILDLCAGTLDLAAIITKRFGHERVVAADFSPQMLERGRRKAPEAELVVADALKLPFSDGEFSSVICGFGMRNLSDPEAGARQVRRVLSPRGLFVTLEFFRPQAPLTKAFHAAYAKIVLPTVGGLLSGHREAYAYLSKSMEGFLTRGQYEDALERAGFVNVRGANLTFGIASIVCAEVPG